MKEKVEYKLEASVDISELIDNFEVVSSTIGFNKNIYVLLIDKLPERIDGMFVQSELSEKHTYKVLEIENVNINEIILYDQKFNFHYVQPLGKENLLLVGARTEYYGNNKYDLNGKIFDLSGVLLKEFLLGDGIQNVQVSKEEVIWTSYFDEGIFGNYGWSKPIGASGLIAWNTDGTKAFSNSEADIADCYALNVVNDNEVWFYYYTDFYLGKITKNTVEFFNPNLSGSNGFILFNDYFLFDNGYENHDEYILMKKDYKGFKKYFTIKFTNGRGETIKSFDRDFRGDMLILREESKYYIIHLRELLDDLL